MCASDLGEPHAHAVDTSARRLLCVCRACRLLFADTSPGPKQRFHIIPERYARVQSALFTDAQWEALGIPIGLAFFFENSESGRIIAFYPSPAGATESQLPMDAWNELREREPLLREMKADVEAVLVYRAARGESQAFVVPIDVCYELVGLIRSKWQGMQGGAEVHAAIAQFCEGIAAREAATAS